MSKVSLDVIVRGRPVLTYRSPDYPGKLFIEGRKGSEYELRLRNNHDRRVKTVVSVDGLNVMTGDHEWDKGYVIDAYGSLTIPGWRIDRDKAARFVFEDIRDSYNQSDQGNVGVIGVMVYEEERSPWVLQDNSVYHHHYHYHPNYYPNWTYPVWSFGTTGGVQNANISEGSITETSNIRLGAASSHSGAVGTAYCASFNNTMQDGYNADEQLGTAWGKEAAFATITVDGKFTTHLETLSIYYDSARGLARRGIQVGRVTHELPKPFPGDFGCPPPRR